MTLAEPQPRQLLTQLVATLLVHLDAVGTAEQERAVRELCQLTQHRVDMLQVSRLLEGLADAHAAAADAAGTAAAVEQPGVAGTAGQPSCSSAAPDFQGKDWPSARAVPSQGQACASPAAALVYATPAAPKARSRLGMMQTTASTKKLQSRVKAMQTGSSSVAKDQAADAALASLAGELTDKLRLADEDANAANSGRDASAPAAADQMDQNKLASVRVRTGRKVRFLDQASTGAQQLSAAAVQQCMYDSEADARLQVPGSLARHGVRRSRLQHNLAATCNQHISNSSGSSSSSRANKSPGVVLAGHSRMPGAAVPPVSPTSSHRAQPAQHGGPWVPSLLLLLDGRLQQLPWESCHGLKQQSMYRQAGLPQAPDNWMMFLIGNITVVFHLTASTDFIMA